MGVQVTKSNLGNTALKFIRDVLRENLTDPSSRGDNSSWIFMTNATKKDINSAGYPFVVIDLIDKRMKQLDIAGNSYLNEFLTFEIRLWADKIADRNTVSDEIMTILQDNSKGDGTYTFKQNYLKFKSYSEVSEDFYQGTKPEIIRAKRITVTFKYYGI
ncbi:MAG: hypothetical protein DRQ02_06275 [Candidatus Latescibacterota bacterium]|nr:MAG: hypothetical protein DRQ02_06275 [Candidatus Latescibacterota bacterium]